ncbi:hypothetical protein AB833_09835 [Chromatiales bacterium (ex Bugula neritina AB1)]|nr:hypothetical protein AB833_09835 [Chromatiales bacterium (ex Bugula neritina AB1)]
MSTHYNYRRVYRGLATLLLLASLGACSLLSDKGPENDYLKAPSGRALELPPEMGVGAVKEPRVQIPELKEEVPVAECVPCSAPSNTAQGNTTAILAPGSVLPASTTGKLIRSGRLVWVEIEARPEQTWELLRQYIEGKGLSVVTANPRQGILETDWLTVDGSDPFSALSDSIKAGSADELGRFRYGFRLERTPKDTSRVFVRHDAILGRGKTQTLEVSDPELSNRLLLDILKTAGLDTSGS